MFYPPGNSPTYLLEQIKYIGSVQCQRPFFLTGTGYEVAECWLMNLLRSILKSEGVFKVTRIRVRKSDTIKGNSPYQKRLHKRQNFRPCTNTNKL